VADRELSIRLSLKDAETVRRALEAVGRDGQAAFDRMTRAAEPASVRLRLVNTAAAEGQAVMRNYAAQLGPVGNALGMLSTRGLVAAAGIGAVALAIGKGLGVSRQLETLKASLVTVTGSASAAATAFEQITAFTTETPFTLDQVASAFIKLKALGLDPSEAALRSYGNTASAMGKSLDQLIEAVADAATGEFERLKEFGIRASSEGSRVTFTFRGISTTVQKEAQAIEGYLRRLGDVEFAGGMERQAQTLETQISNLTDAWRLFLAEVANVSGARSAAGGFLTWLTEAATQARRGLAATTDFSRQIVENARQIRTIEDELAQLRAMGMSEKDPEVSSRLPILARMREEEAKLIAAARAEADAAGADAARVKAEADAQAAAKAEARAAAIARLTAEQAREIELARMAADVRAQQNAADRAEADLRKEVADATDAEIAAARARAIEAVKTQQAVSAAASAGSKAEADAAREAKKNAEDWLRVIGTVNEEQRRSTEAKAEAHDDIAEQIAGIEAETRQFGLSNVEREIAVELIKAEALAKRANTAVTEDERKAIEAATRARAAERERIEQQTRAREDAAREAERTTDRVVDYAGDTFADFFADTPKSWKDMWNDMYSTAKQTLAKLGGDLILRPVIAPVVNAVYGVQGAGDAPGLGGIGGGATGTRGPGITDLGNLLSQQNAIFGGLTSSINSFGASLGFASGAQIAAPSASFVGPMPLAQGSLFGTTTLSGFLGGVGAGFGAGTMLGSLLGATQTNSMIGSGGGALLGAGIGSIVPGIGTLVGGLVGGLLGGGLSALFGKGGKDKLKILSADNPQGNALLGDTFDDDLALRSPFGYVGLSDNKTSGHDAAFVSKLVQTLRRSDQGAAQYLSGSEIATVSTALQNQGGYNRSDRKFGEEEFGKVIRGRLKPILEALDINGQLIAATLAGTDAEELQAAAQELLARRQAVRDIIDYSGEEGEIHKAERSAFMQLQSAIDELAVANDDFGFSADKAAAAQKRLVEEYLGLADAIEPMTAAEKALAAMNERIAQTAELAKQVGIDLTPAEIETKLREQLRTGFDGGIAEQIKALTDPLGAALDAWQKAADARLADAKLLGGNLVEVERLNAIERQRIVEQYTGAAADTIRGFLTDQFQGAGSVLAPRTTLVNAEAEFDRLLGLARGGDAAALADITSAAQNYLNAQRAISASGPEFFQVFDRVTDSLKAFVGDTTGMLSSGATAAASLVPLLGDIEKATADGNAAIVAELVGLRRTLAGGLTSGPTAAAIVNVQPAAVTVVADLAAAGTPSYAAGDAAAGAMARVASNTEQLGPILKSLASESARGFERLVQENRMLNRKVEELTEAVRRQQDALDRLTARVRAA
jgi:chemotaxis protein histidine kinase CheA